MERQTACVGMINRMFRKAALGCLRKPGEGGRGMRENSIAAKIDSALRMAASDGDTESVKALLDAGADVHNGVDAPLWFAAIGHHADTMQIGRASCRERENIASGAGS